MFGWDKVKGAVKITDVIAFSFEFISTPGYLTVFLEEEEEEKYA